MYIRAIFVIFTIFFFTTAIGFEDTKCFPNDLRQTTCEQNEMCLSHGNNNGVCRCKVGYVRSPNSECLQVSTSKPSASASAYSPGHAEMVYQSSVSTGAITAAVLVPLVLAIGGLLVFIGRRYNWFERLQLLQGRHYEEVRIGQEDDDDDDPPLA